MTTENITINVNRHQLHLIVTAALAGFVGDEGSAFWSHAGAKELLQDYMNVGEPKGVLALTSIDAIQTLTEMTKELLK